METPSELLTEAMKDVGDQQISGIGVPDFTPVLCFTTFFAEWVIKNGDLVFHLFPRLGPDDRWFEGQYIKGKYYEARREQKAEGADFPENMTDHIKASANEIWFGDVELDFVEELGAHAVKFVDVASTIDMKGVDKGGGFIDKFLTHIDNSLEN